MNFTIQIKHLLQRYRSLVATIMLLLVVYAFIYSAIQQPLLSHNDWDSYSLEASQWLAGKLALEQDYPWLELAIFKDHYYVSFPPVPAIVQLPLIPFFQTKTPSNLLVTIYALLCGIVLFNLVSRKTKQRGVAAFWTFILMLGTNVLFMSVNGGVWFQAQMLSFLFSLLAIALMTGKSRIGWALSLLLWALSVGCRPFQILYGPVLFIMLIQHIREIGTKRSFPRTVIQAVPYLLAPFFIGVMLGIFNWLRFGNFLEFGHSYLPEFVRASDGQFSTTYLKDNLVRTTMGFPTIENGTVHFPRFGSFAFYVANPIFVIALFKSVFALRKRKIDLVAVVLWVTFIFHIGIFLTHKSLGGWQFGSRYFVDLLPYVFLLIYRIDLKPKVWDIALGLFGIVLNIYGCLWLFLNWS